MAKLAKSKKKEDSSKFVSAVTGGLPFVDLLPASIAEAVKQRKLIRKFAASGVGAVALVAGVFLAQSASVAIANGHLSDAQKQTQVLAKKQAALAPVAGFYADVETGKKIVTTTMSASVEYDKVIRVLAADTPVGVDLGSLSLAGSSTSSCPSQDPFHPNATAGCVTFTGTARNVALVSTFLIRLKTDAAFTGVFVTSTSAGDKGTSFNGTVGFSSTFYSKRFVADQTTLVPGAVPALTTPATTAPVK